MQFNDLVRLQKQMPRECPVRLIPFINDPLAFVGEKNVGEDAAFLKLCLKNRAGADPALKEALEGIDESVAAIRKAEGALKEVEGRGREAFAGFDCSARSSLCQTDAGIEKTLCFDAFKEAGGAEISFQAHFTPGLKTVSARVVALPKGSGRQLGKAMKRFESAGWRLEAAGPGSQGLALERKVSGNEALAETLIEGKRMLSGLEKKLSA
ncbi:MAG: hypothetical protein PHF51_02320 [Candidatus ainarchaeum sp.]|nr:hypothetical protein [Candidatus ainarchaeum sp.]